MKVKKN